MIKIQKLTKTYYSTNGSVEALKGIDLTIEKGEIFGIIGLSGAGKSTLIRTLNRLEEPTSGQIKVGSQDIVKLTVTELKEYRKKVGMIFQHFNLLKSRDVYGNVKFPLEIAKEDKSIMEKRVTEMLELVGLKDKAKSFPSQLSGGQKQRVAIARALSNYPELLLCDEATSSLDPKTTQQILRLLSDIRNKLGLTIVLITHEMEVIKSICDKVAVIDDGKIIECGLVKDVFNHPQEAITKEFIEHLPEVQYGIKAVKEVKAC